MGGNTQATNREAGIANRGLLWPQTQPQRLSPVGGTAVGAASKAALRSPIPTGLHHSAQGCRACEATLGHRRQSNANPNGVASTCNHGAIQPFQGCAPCSTKPRVARNAQPWADRLNPFRIGIPNHEPQSLRNADRWGTPRPATLALPIPTGLHHSAQGCEERATLGVRPPNALNPERVEANRT